MAVVAWLLQLAAMQAGGTAPTTAAVQRRPAGPSRALPPAQSVACKRNSPTVKFGTSSRDQDAKLYISADHEKGAFGTCRQARLCCCWRRRQGAAGQPSAAGWWQGMQRSTAAFANNRATRLSSRHTSALCIDRLPTARHYAAPCFAAPALLPRLPAAPAPSPPTLPAAWAARRCPTSRAPAPPPVAAPAAWQTTPATCPAQVRPACRADCPAAHVHGCGWAACCLRHVPVAHCTNSESLAAVPRAYLPPPACLLPAGAYYA